MAKPKTSVKGTMSRRKAEDNTMHEKLRNDIDKIPRGSKPSGKAKPAVKRSAGASKKGMY